jgi:hypothetical protein
VHGLPAAADAFLAEAFTAEGCFDEAAARGFLAAVAGAGVTDALPRLRPVAGGGAALLSPFSPPPGAASISVGPMPFLSRQVVQP